MLGAGKVAHRKRCILHVLSRIVGGNIDEHIESQRRFIAYIDRGNLVFVKSLEFCSVTCMELQ